MREIYSFFGVNTSASTSMYNQTAHFARGEDEEEEREHSQNLEEEEGDDDNRPSSSSSPLI